MTSDQPLADIIEHHHGSTSGFSRHYLTLYSLVLGLEAKNVFEFGSGFSTPTILAALRQTGGRLTTCDMRSIAETGNDQGLAQQHADRWTFLQGDSREQIQKVHGQAFDFVLHDGSHEWRVVWRDLRAILPQMKRDSIILVHDTEHIPTYRLKLAVWLALLFVPHEKVTLPYGYGLTIIRVLADYGNGAISTQWKKTKGG